MIRIVVELPDFGGDDATARGYVASMLTDGETILTTEGGHMGTTAVILGVLDEAGQRQYGEWITPL